MALYLPKPRKYAKALAAGLGVTGDRPQGPEVCTSPPLGGPFQLHGATGWAFSEMGLRLTQHGQAALAPSL